MVEAENYEDAIDMCDKEIEEDGYNGFEEETEGTNGAERVYEWKNSKPRVVYSTGTKAGLEDSE